MYYFEFTLYLSKGSWDYFGLNHYTSAYSQDYPSAPTDQGWDTDQQVNVSQSRDGTLKIILYNLFYITI